MARNDLDADCVTVDQFVRRVALTGSDDKRDIVIEILHTIGGKCPRACSHEVADRATVLEESVNGMAGVVDGPREMIAEPIPELCRIGHQCRGVNRSFSGGTNYR